MASEAQTVIGEASQQRWDWWRFGDGGVLAAYSAVVLWTLQYHEKWADEAQAWLIARDLDLGTIWFHELRYEGSPGLWHTILWVAQHVFHAGYGAIGYIGAAFAIAGAALLLFCAPFPRYIRWPLAFTYVMVYQYAVIARPYTLLPLLAFLAAYFFKDAKHPGRITTVLVLMCMLTLHGAILAGCLGLGYAVDAAKGWSRLDHLLQRRYLLSMVVLICTFGFLIVILRPTPDVGEFATKKESIQQPNSVRNLQPGPVQKTEAIISGAFLDYIGPSILFVVVAGVWSAYRRRISVFVLPVVLLIVLYAFIHGYPHHHGTVYIASIVAFWVAWPEPAERERFTPMDLLVEKGMIFALCCLILVNAFDAAVAIRREFLYPYSGAPDASRFIRGLGADKSTMFGYLFGVVSVQAFFDHNLFANIPTAYFHHGLPIRGEDLDLDELHRIKPQFILAYSVDPQAMMDTGVPLFREQGYELIHFSDGYYLYKRAVYQRESFFIFRRLPEELIDPEIEQRSGGKLYNQDIPRSNGITNR